MVTPQKLKKRIALYVIEDMLPLSTVDCPAFRKLISEISYATVPDRKTFTHYLDKAYDVMEGELKKSFENVAYVSTTADIWTANNKSFLGMTAHWIDPATLQRKRVALTCSRFKGRHTYDAVAAEIEQCHAAYALNAKVTATVTDNGSNFVKAFNFYKRSAKSDNDTASEEEGVSDLDVTFTDIQEVLSSEEHGDQEYVLPPHRRCAAHTLNLIALVSTIRIVVKIKVHTSNKRDGE
ncbi:UNVERIFIED_CONTAM: hypothetical protein FKN15_048799 [Acipenser sinensis]